MYIEELNLTIEPTPQELLALSGTSFLRTLKRTTASDDRLPKGAIVNVRNTQRVGFVTETLGQHALVHFITFDQATASWFPQGTRDVVRFDQVERIEVPSEAEMQQGAASLFRSAASKAQYRKYGDVPKNERWW